MKVEIDAAGTTMRFQGRNMLTAIKGAVPAFAMNITFVAEKKEGDEDFEDFNEPGVIDEMEKEVVAALHEALEKHGIHKPAAEIEI